jgi:signal transduction histidine kinase/CheY-like chemotaxis protein
MGVRLRGRAAGWIILALASLAYGHAAVLALTSLGLGDALGMTDFPRPALSAAAMTLAGTFALWLRPQLHRLVGSGTTLVVALLLATITTLVVPAQRVAGGVLQVFLVPILLAAVTTSFRQTLGVALFTYGIVLARFHPVPILWAPGTWINSTVIVLLVLTLRWLHDAGLAEASTSHQRSLDVEREAHGARERELQARVLLAQNLSHELRTPLSHIRAALDEGPPSAERRAGWWEQVAQAVGTLERHVDRVLLLDQVEQRSVRPRGTPHTLDDLRAALDATWRPLVEARGLRLRVEAEGEGAAFLVDGALARRAIGELVDNARHFTPSGAVVVRLRHDGGGAPRLVVEVEDTGPGLDTSLVDLAARTMQQADMTHRRARGGLGIGLALASQIAASLDGDLAHEPAAGGGSVFRLTVPAPHAPATGDAPAVDASSPPIEPLRVLFVDDHPINLRVVRAQLASRGCEVVTVDSGAHALEALRDPTRERAFHVLLTDIQMPEMDGFELARQVSRQPETAPLLFGLTAAIPESLLEESIRSGLLELYAKPLPLDRFLEAVARRRAALTDPRA